MTGAAMKQELRHYCRNLKCRMKLKAPVSNLHKAFCTKGCYSSFYLTRCLVCENEKPEGSQSNRRFCRRPKCSAEYRRNSLLFDFSTQVSTRGIGNRTRWPRKPNKTGHYFPPFVRSGVAYRGRSGSRP